MPVPLITYQLPLNNEKQFFNLKEIDSEIDQDSIYKN
jgi:hypothetical protein